MNYKKACNLLGLEKQFTQSELKKAYYKKALLYHPDKNSETEEKFKQIGTAYEFLQKNKKFKIERCTFTYIELINKVFNMDLNNIQKIFDNCGKISLKVFGKLRKELAINIYQAVLKYKDIISITDETLKKMKEIVHKKMEKDNIIILNPTIDDIFQGKVYKLNFKGVMYLCPLWHHEILFDHSGNDLIIRINPEVSDNIQIDENNNIIVNIRDKISKIFHDGAIVFFIGTKKFSIASAYLRIVKNQSYLLKNVGLYSIVDNDVYNTAKRSNILVQIQLDV